MSWVSLTVAAYRAYDFAIDWITFVAANMIAALVLLPVMLLLNAIWKSLFRRRPRTRKLGG